MIFFKKIFFFVFANLLIFFFLEIFFTAFFVIHKTNYYGPIARLIIPQEKNIANRVSYEIKYDKSTGKYLPGEYIYNGIPYKINKFGFIGEEFEVENSTGCRIISFGGSTTAGMESEKSYPKFLEEILQKKKNNCEVLNFGFSGKGLNFLEDLLVNEAVKYNPNIITIMSNRNSVMYNSFTTSSTPTDVIKNTYDLFIYEIKNFLFSEIMTYRFMNLAFNRFGSLFFNKEDKILSPFHPRSYHLKKYFETKYKNQILKINSYCKAKNIKLVLIKQAYFIDLDFQKEIYSNSKDEIINKLTKYHKEKNIDKVSLFWMYTNAILNKILDEIKTVDKSVVVIDPTIELYSKDKLTYFMPDGLHLNNKGNRVIAENIFNSLASHGVLEN